MDVAGRSNPSLRCVLMALTRTPLQDEDASQLPSCSCTSVQTFNAGSSCKLLTKNAVFRSPDGTGSLVCAGDEASSSTMVSPVHIDTDVVLTFGAVTGQSVRRLLQQLCWLLMVTNSHGLGLVTVEPKYLPLSLLSGVGCHQRLSAPEASS